MRKNYKETQNQKADLKHILGPSQLGPLEWPLLREQKVTSIGDSERLKPLYIVGGNIKWYSHYEKQYEARIFIFFYTYLYLPNFYILNFYNSYQAEAEANQVKPTKKKLYWQLSIYMH